MIFVTAHFGPVAVDESSTIEFPNGLPGFEESRRFLPLQNPQQGGLIFLQSLECAELCFLALPVRALRRDYELSVTAEDRDTLRLPATGSLAIGSDVIALALVSLAEGEAPTANLRSPVLIHMQGRVAVQAIRPDERYGIREPLTYAETGEPVCS